MSLTLDQLREEVLALSLEDRQDFIASVSRDLNIVPSELHPAWEEEIQRRMEEFRAGRMETIPWEVVQKELDGLDDLP